MRLRAHSVAIAVVALIGLGLGLFLFLRARNQTAFDTWIGRQVVGIVGSYLEPRIDFQTLRYRSPRTVEITDASLVSPDGTRVADIGVLTIELVRAPARGRPLEVRRIAISGAQVHLIETDAGHFKGLRPFLRTKPGQETESIPTEFRLSNVLRLERLEIRDLSLTYTPAGSAPAMTLNGLALDLNIAEDSTGGPGWYSIDTSFGRLPQFSVNAAGAVNLDTLVARLDRTELDIDINPQTMGSLPPALQELAASFGARGHLSAELAGNIPILEAGKSELDGALALESFSVTSGEYVLAIDNATASLGLHARRLKIEPLNLRTLGGRVRATLLSDLGQPGRPTDLAWQIDNVNLRSLLRAGGQEPKFAGILGGSGLVRTNLDTPLASLSGSGTVAVRKGHFMAVSALEKVAGLFDANAGREPGLNHRADVQFNVTPDGLVITQSEFESEFALARGTGKVTFDGRLDLYFNAGPLEKLQSVLGAVGRAFGNLTDRLVRYHVHGRIGDVRVDVLPLGIGLEPRAPRPALLGKN